MVALSWTKSTLSARTLSILVKAESSSAGGISHHPSKFYFSRLTVYYRDLCFGLSSEIQCCVIDGVDQSESNYVPGGPESPSGILGPSQDLLNPMDEPVQPSPSTKNSKPLDVKGPFATPEEGVTETPPEGQVTDGSNMLSTYWSDKLDWSPNTTPSSNVNDLLTNIPGLGNLRLDNVGDINPDEPSTQP